MSRARHLLQMTCRSRSLTPTGGTSASPCCRAAGCAVRRSSLHVPPLTPVTPLSAGSATPVLGVTDPGRRERRGSTVSPAALLFRSGLGADPPRRRPVLAQPRLLVTPGSPPEELPPALPQGDALGVTYAVPPPPPPPPPSADAARPTGELLPPSPGLKFDTPERGEVEENGLDGHPEAPVLGRGSFGTVVLGKRKDRAVAVKVLRGRQPSAGELLAVLGVYGLNAAFSTVEMEYCGDLTLQMLLDDRDAPLPVAAVGRYASQLVSALAYCHAEGVIHLDVKPANVIVADSGDIKLGDFGSARCVGDPDARGSGVRGTVPYMAPELFRGECATCRADIYSFGVCTWQLLTGYRPFASLEADVVIYVVVARWRRPEPEVPANAGRWREVVERCWAQHAENRPDAAELERWMLQLDNTGHWPSAFC
ncbi:proline-rich receptor-like protein kinase PERK2 [Pollicipes pollicipes]|uniref:proline-rich receptor-like protein kinase PERK2 n=1 Tax=Pollicipes pollicipes TaxID=41117 RepID=UPI0018850F00|nr:proline-rich receptor-like protein kinase PERK2 [Pollicipes pollicipes]